RTTGGRDGFEGLFFATLALGDALSAGDSEVSGEVVAGIPEGSELANPIGLGVGASGVGVSAIIGVGVAVGLTSGVGVSVACGDGVSTGVGVGATSGVVVAREIAVSPGVGDVTIRARLCATRFSPP